MREYGKVSPSFWIGETGIKLRQAGAEAQLVALYLVTCPSSNMIGIYHLPLPLLAHHTSLGLEGASKALRRVVETGFCRWDDPTEMVFIPQMAAHQIGEKIVARDKRHTGIVRELYAMRKCLFAREFCEIYREAFSLPEGSPFEAPCKPLRSQEQEQEQEQEQDVFWGPKPKKQKSPPSKKPRRTDNPESSDGDHTCETVVPKHQTVEAPLTAQQQDRLDTVEAPLTAQQQQDRHIPEAPLADQQQQDRHIPEAPLADQQQQDRQEIVAGLTRAWCSAVRFRKAESIKVCNEAFEEMLCQGLPAQLIHAEILLSGTTVPKRDRSEWLKEFWVRLKAQTGLAENSLFTGPVLMQETSSRALDDVTDFDVFRREFAARFLGPKQDSEFVVPWEKEFAKMKASLEELRQSLDSYAADPRRTGAKKFGWPKDALPFLLGYIREKRRSSSAAKTGLAPGWTQEMEDAANRRSDEGLLKRGKITQTEFDAREAKRAERATKTG